MTVDNETTTVSPSSHAVDAAGVAPNDLEDLPRQMCIGLSCAGAGAASIITERGSSVVVYLVPGNIFPQGTRRVLLTGTDATGIVAHYR